MSKILKIVVPVDFSAVSLKTLEFIKLTTVKASADVNLVHVVQVNDEDWVCNAENNETIDRKALQEQEQLALDRFKDLQQQVEFTFNYHVIYGGLTTSLVKFAAQKQADLMVMGTKGANGWLEKLSGSEAQQVVRHAHVPVISIHEHALVSPIKNILWLTGLEAENQPNHSLDTIKVLQNLFDAKLNLLHIITQDEEKQAETINTKLNQLAEKLELQNYEVHLRHDYKVPAGVRNFNQEADMDLVVVGTHARKGLNHLFFGSIAETLVNHCIRPLATYHLEL